MAAPPARDKQIGASGASEQFVCVCVEALAPSGSICLPLAAGPFGLAHPRALRQVKSLDPVDAAAAAAAA